jgi:beta-lactamase superfamily II metal-dependent hydrolase
VGELKDLLAGAFEIELLPARHGDAILLTWGAADERHRLLVDGGPARAYARVGERMAEVAAAGSLDLLVLTHVDADHIEGTILLTNDAGVGIGIDEIWFNGPGQLSDELSAAQGEMFAALIGAREIPFNRAFKGRAVRVQDDAPLPSHDLHGLTLTVLGPDGRSLCRLRDAWNNTLEDEALHFASAEEALDALRRRRSLNPDDAYLAAPEELDSAWVTELAGRPVPGDDSVPNASSIVLLAEYGGASVLLAGDATAPELTSGIRRLLAERQLERLDLTAMKVPHHGSVRNVTRDLLALAPAERYLFSSDGSRFGHPDAAGVARVLEYGSPGAELVFNYRTPQTLLWDDEAVLGASAARYPEPGTDGVRLALAPRRYEAAS